MALIFRPLIPPVSLTCLTKSSIAFVRSPIRRPQRFPPAGQRTQGHSREDDVDVVSCHSRLDVLAVLTGEGEPVGCRRSEFAAGVEEADAPQAVVRQSRRRRVPPW